MEKMNNALESKNAHRVDIGKDEDVTSSFIRTTNNQKTLKKLTPLATTKELPTDHDTFTTSSVRPSTSGRTTDLLTWKYADNVCTSIHRFDPLSMVHGLREIYIMLGQNLKQPCKQRQKVTAPTLTELHSFDPMAVSNVLIRFLRLVSRITMIRTPLAFMLLLMLIGSARALDNDIALQAYPANIVVPDPGNRAPIGLVGTYIFVVAGLLTTTAASLLGPLMGVSSVLWFIMRNDAAIKPSASWAIFGVWGSVTLVYLSYQTRRVMLGKLYILLALAFAGMCLCIVAIVQKSSIQGGLVTAIPPCTSFAAYAVAFCFPTQRHAGQQMMV